MKRNNILVCVKREADDIGRKLKSWLEWQDAKAWANQYHPAWVEIATKSKSEEAREYYRKMILGAYRGAEYV
jgi:hypothetical protein